MKTRWLILAAVILALSGIASANNVECNLVLTSPATYGVSGVASTVSVLNSLASNATYNDGCWEGDIFFSAFNYAPTAGGAETATSVTPNFSAFPNNFAGLALGTGVGYWGGTEGGFTWTYEEQICTMVLCGVAPYEGIIKADVQESPNSATAVLNYTITGVSGITYTGTTNPSALPNPILGFSGWEPGINAVLFSDSYNGSGGLFMTGVTNDVYESQLPEPGTMLLMGGALVGLGAIARKRRKA